MLTGERLFEAKREAHVVMRVLSEVIGPPSAVVGEIPHTLDDVVMKGRAREPQDRSAPRRRWRSLSSAAA